MPQQNFRAIWIASAIVGWCSLLPVTSACDTSDLLSGGCAFSESTMIGLIVGGVILVLFIVICSACIRLRRIRSRPARIGRMSTLPNGVVAHSPNSQKPWNPPVANGFPGYGQPPPVPWPAQAPRYPPPAHDAQYHGHRSEISSQWSSPSTVYPMPEPTTPTSPLSTRTSSATMSRPAPSIDTTPASLRPSVQRDESTRMRPQPSSTSLAPRSPQNNVIEAPLPPIPSSPPRSPQTLLAGPLTPSSSSTPQSPQRIVAESPPSVSSPPSRRPTVDMPPPASPPPRQPSGDIPQLNQQPLIIMSPVDTGATNNGTDPPPPYTLM